MEKLTQNGQRSRAITLQSCETLIELFVPKRVDSVRKSIGYFGRQFDRRRVADDRGAPNNTRVVTTIVPVHPHLSCCRLWGGSAERLFADFARSFLHVVLGKAMPLGK